MKKRPPAKQVAVYTSQLLSLTLLIFVCEIFLNLLNSGHPVLFTQIIGVL